MPSAALFISAITIHELESGRELILRRINREREHLLTQIEGLPDARLRHPVLPSGWSCLGLVRHLTLSDERYWFEVVMAGGSLDFWPIGDNADWRVDDDEPAPTVINDYREAIARADIIIAGLRLDDPPARPESWGSDLVCRFLISGRSWSTISSRPQPTPANSTQCGNRWTAGNTSSSEPAAEQTS